MSTMALVKDLKPIDFPLSSIFLDSNNPRFVDQNWTDISDDDIDKDAVQDEIR